MLRTEEEWKCLFTQERALWTHDGDNTKPHVQLPCGKHTGIHFTSERILENPSLVDQAAKDMLELLLKYGMDIESIDRVAGSAYGGITLAHDIARRISHQRGRECLRAFAHKREDRGTSIGMRFLESSVRPSEKVLLVNDKIVTGRSTKFLIHAIGVANADVQPFLGVLVNWSGEPTIDGLAIVSLISQPITLWESDKCPLCIAGSKPLRPDSIGNWEALHYTR